MQLTLSGRKAASQRWSSKNTHRPPPSPLLFLLAACPGLLLHGAGFASFPQATNRWERLAPSSPPSPHRHEGRRKERVVFCHAKLGEGTENCCFLQRAPSLPHSQEPLCFLASCSNPQSWCFNTKVGQKRDRDRGEGRLVLVVFLVIVFRRVGVPCQPLLVERNDHLWALDVRFLGRDQVCFIRVLPAEPRGKGNQTENFSRKIPRCINYMFSNMDVWGCHLGT